ISQQKVNYSCSSLQVYNPAHAKAQIHASDVVIAGNATPNQSAVEIGGMDDLKDDSNFALNNAAQPKALQ
ncbi:glycosyl hydrolase family 3, partial [Pseudoalteromonas issachenkonii]